MAGFSKKDAQEIAKHIRDARTLKAKKGIDDVIGEYRPHMMKCFRLEGNLKSGDTITGRMQICGSTPGELVDSDEPETPIAVYAGKMIPVGKMLELDAIVWCQYQREWYLVSTNVCVVDDPDYEPEE